MSLFDTLVQFGVSVRIFTSVIYQHMQDPYASLLSGMVLGVELPRSLEIYETFKKTGLLHLVVLSGSNINFLVVTVTRLCKVFGQKISAAISIITVASFIVFVGPEPPVVRAGLMSASTLLALIFNRQSFALISLCTTALVIGVVKFEWLATVSFQLSFGASLGIILWSKKQTKVKSTEQKDKDGSASTGSTLGLTKRIGVRTIATVREDLHTTLSAQLVTTPIIIFYFGEVSLISPLSNLLVGFTAGPIMMLGLLGVLLGKISYFAGYIPLKLAYVVLKYVVWVTELTASIPFYTLKI